MEDQERERQQGTMQAGRGGDRRGRDRRRTDRRTPPPVWRRPWAYVGYGVLGALLVVIAFRVSGDPPVANGEEASEVVRAPVTHDVNRELPPAAGAPPRDAHSDEAFARLLADGDAAQGQRVNTRLFCGSINPVSVRSVPDVPRTVAELTDSSGRVPAAECKWGSATAAPDFLLLIPASSADRFTAAPMVEQGFVRRRRLDVEVEWLGRSEALALRTAGVLREIR